MRVLRSPLPSLPLLIPVLFIAKPFDYTARFFMLYHHELYSVAEPHAHTPPMLTPIARVEFAFPDRPVFAITTR